MLAFVKPDADTGEFVPTTLEDYHRSLTAIQLHESVPEDVCSYFETVKNICLYGWFVYPFFAIAEFLSYTAVELALRERLYPARKGKAPGLKQLLKRAIDKGLISDAGFASIQRQREYFQELEAHVGPIYSTRRSEYTTILLDTLPFLRN